MAIMDWLEKFGSPSRRIASFDPRRLASVEGGRTVGAQIPPRTEAAPYPSHTPMPEYSTGIPYGPPSPIGKKPGGYLDKMRVPAPGPEGFAAWPSGYSEWAPDGDMRGRAEAEIDAIMAEQYGAISESEAAAEREYQEILNAIGASREESLATDVTLREELDLQRERRLAARGLDVGGAYRYNVGRGIEADLARAADIQRTYQTQRGTAALSRQEELGFLTRERGEIAGSREGMIAALIRALEGESFGRYAQTLPYAMEAAQYGPETEYGAYVDQRDYDLRREQFEYGRQSDAMERVEEEIERRAMAMNITSQAEYDKLVSEVMAQYGYYY